MKKNPHYLSKNPDCMRLLVLLSGAVLALAPIRTLAATFTVNSTNDADDGACNATHCSLREAIDQANNAAGADTIKFNISGVTVGDVHTISPNSQLPALEPNGGTGNGTTIDGTSQTVISNTNPNGPEIQLSGASSQGTSVGLRILAANCTVKGLVINQFSSSGVLIMGRNATGNKVEGCYIGTNAAGNAALGNAGPGVYILQAHNNTVGGTTASARNILSGNAQPGILMNGENNTVQGNYIGTNKDGTDDVPNTQNGVHISGAAKTNTIGGTAAGSGNLISGNGENGVVIDASNRSSVKDNKVQGNFIGTDKNGSTALPNSKAGVLIFNGAQNSLVGGTTSNARNVISGNGENGVLISGKGTKDNKVQGNYIGTNKDGNDDLSNGTGRSGDGVRISDGADKNTVGGMVTTPGTAPGNLISGNKGDGIEIRESDNTQVLGNLIGTDKNGATAVRNEAHGVFIDFNANNNLIGGTAGPSGSGARNVISGNKLHGVLIESGKKNKVLGNTIGTNAAGDADLPSIFVSSGDGVRVTGKSNGNIIGAGGFGNLVSGNAGNGVTFSGPFVKNNFIQGNFIGTDAAGTSAIANGEQILLSAGVRIEAGAKGNQIGGQPGGGLFQFNPRNLISGNRGDGIWIDGNGTKNNRVQGNTIGTDVSGNNPLPNDRAGVIIGSVASLNLIGAPSGGVSPLGNRIAFNGSFGVWIGGGDEINNLTASNPIRGNSIHSNGGIGINLGVAQGGGTSVDDNDAMDPDLGPNRRQNYPVLTSVTSSASDDTTTIEGTLNSKPNTGFQIDIYRNTVAVGADPSGFGEGEVPVESTAVLTDAGGDGTFSVTFEGDFTGQFFTATATSPTLDTSEFSAAVKAVPGRARSSASRSTSPVTMSAARAQVTSASVELNFTAALNAASASDITRYALEVNGVPVTIESVSYRADNNSVTLRLAAGTLRKGDQVAVSWTDLRDAQGNALEGHSGMITAQ